MDDIPFRTEETKEGQLIKVMKAMKTPDDAVLQLTAEHA